MRDLVFVTHGKPSRGFGHVARCLELRRLALARDPSLRMAFRGDFSVGAMTRIAASAPGLELLPPGDSSPSRVAVIDRMADAQRMDWIDSDLVKRTAAGAEQVLYISSSHVAPSLPEGVRCVGYQPGDARPATGRAWGLEYAPVSSGLIRGDVVPDEERAFVALGGYDNDEAIVAVLEGLDQLEQVRVIDLLRSPVDSGESALPELQTPIEMHHNVPSVAPLLARAGVVVASYGNLCFEALALGCALVVGGQKRFQAEMAGRLAALGCAVDAGFFAERPAEDLATTIAGAIETRGALRAAASRAVDGRGLDRITDMIFELSKPEGGQE